MVNVMFYIGDDVYMIANSTDVKNNFGKYIRLSYKEDVIITSNGKKIARLTAYDENYKKDDTGWCIREGSMAYELPPRKVAYEEFLEISEESEQRLEYIDGEVYLLSSPTISHQLALGEMHIIFYEWFRGKKCKPALAPFDIKLKRKNGERNMVQPDLMVICDLYENQNENGKYDGVPVLVVEIISEGTRKKDLINKFDLYLSAGVKEYWIVNPINKDVTVYQFEEGEIVNSMTYKGQETVKSYVFEGLGMEVERVFK